MNDVSIEKINHVIEGIIREVEIPISFVPIHRLTKSFRMEVMGDGIHYKVCHSVIYYLCPRLFLTWLVFSFRRLTLPWFSR